jgi:hypothetical protein
MISSGAVRREKRKLIVIDRQALAGASTRTPPADSVAPAKQYQACVTSL